jgi:hypothetical protein
VTAAAPPCPLCGVTTARAWLTTPAAVIGDEMDQVITNGTKVPIRFRSRTAFKHWLKAEGLQQVGHHVGLLGSDKNPQTTNWAASYDPYTAANVKLLLERAFHAGPSEPPVEPLHVTTTIRDLSREEAQQYVRR